jgi:UDP-2,3-diacylglucosamine pyrophosphatase LpxH
MFACGQQAKKQEVKTVEVEKAAVVLSIDEVLEQATDLADKEVVVKGTVMHVCKQGGHRCFLMGSNEDITIRVEAGEKIGAFDQEQMGSELQIVGLLKEVKTEADAHNPGKEHGEHAEGEEHEHDAEANEAHQTIAKNQESAERVFFIEGLKVKEI